MRKIYLFALLTTMLITVSCSKFDDGGITGIRGNTHKGKEWVDLGLPSGNKWAKANIGAKDSLDPGNYYRWGSTVTVEELLKEESESSSMSFIKAYDSPFSYDNISGTEYDVAHKEWKGKWRMPTKEDYEELFEYCKARYTLIGEKGGYLFTAENGNTLFLPNTGHYTPTDRYPSAIHYGYYWTATNCIELRFFKSKEVRLKSCDSGFGLAVRAICD